MQKTSFLASVLLMTTLVSGCFGDAAEDREGRLVVMWFSFEVDIPEGESTAADLGAHCAFTQYTTRPASLHHQAPPDEPYEDGYLVRDLAPGQSVEGVMSLGESPSLIPLVVGAPVSVTAAFDPGHVLVTVERTPEGGVLVDGAPLPAGAAFHNVTRSYEGMDGHAVTETLHFRDFGTVPYHFQRLEGACL